MVEVKTEKVKVDENADPIWSCDEMDILVQKLKDDSTLPTNASVKEITITVGENPKVTYEVKEAPEP